MSRDLLCAIILIINLLLKGRCMTILAEFVTSASLTPLLFVCFIYRLLASKVAMKRVSKNVERYLNDFLFRVRVSGGVEATFHNANRVLSKWNGDGSFTMIMVDLTNAFNLVDLPSIL